MANVGVMAGVAVSVGSGVSLGRAVGVEDGVSVAVEVSVNEAVGTLKVEEGSADDKVADGLHEDTVSRMNKMNAKICLHAGFIIPPEIIDPATRRPTSAGKHCKAVRRLWLWSAFAH